MKQIGAKVKIQKGVEIIKEETEEGGGQEEEECEKQIQQLKQGS